MPAAAKDIDVFGHVATLLRGEESVDDFIDWFWSAYSAIDRDGTDDAYDLSGSIANWLYQLDGDYIDEEEFLTGLREDAEELGIEWREAPASAGTPRLAS